MESLESAVVEARRLPVGTHRFTVQTAGWKEFGLQWVSEGAGEATHAVYVTSAPRAVVTGEFPDGSDREDPALNRRWQADARLAFAKEPSGPGGSLPLQAGCHGWSHLLVEVEVTVELESYSLYFTGIC